ncbi:SRPBCC family protein [Erythrobacter sp.]|uniref:SRPBCC family protein n=1 Tax=Erythrobacter sp. TaxID=1042 RepID=UPI001B18AAC3|nr:SRPBCC family protein [Erythrobacter sp.]MBO6525963.1 SRPBCC family protein [Erythrobacter sp.]MBO6529362.1 SRPBCC family protein [Erythrobacter sp.]
MRPVATVLAAAAALAAAPLSAKVAETSATGFVTQDMAEVAASPLDTWLALTRPGTWWNDAHTWSGDADNMTLTPQAGGCFCERVPGEDRADGFSLDGSVQHMSVVQAYPLRNLRMRGGLGPLQGEPATGVLTITLEEIEGGTRIRWEYVVGGHMRYEIDTISKAVDGVMSQQLAGLRDHLGALESADAPQEDADNVPDEEPSIEAQIDAMQDTE